jgi:hypothetical protein
MNNTKGQEYPIPDEAAYTDKLVALFSKILLSYYPSGTTKRLFHPKMHGLVKAEFQVSDHLDESLRTSLFQPGAMYPAWIRFSNGKRHPAADQKKDLREMAIKLIGVHGPISLPPEKKKLSPMILCWLPLKPCKRSLLKIFINP